MGTSLRPSVDVAVLVCLGSSCEDSLWLLSHGLIATFVTDEYNCRDLLLTWRISLDQFLPWQGLNLNSCVLPGCGVNADSCVPAPVLSSCDTFFHDVVKWHLYQSDQESVGSPHNTILVQKMEFF